MSEHPELPDFLEKNTADLTNGHGKDLTIPTTDILNVLEQFKASQSESSQTQTQSQSQSQSQSQLQDPPSKWDTLRTNLSEKLHDPDGWRRLVEIAETSSDAEQIKATYEALLTHYLNMVCLTLCCYTFRIDQSSLSSPLPKSRTSTIF
jgi:hypothetical protein